jgi:tRNA threonylcarbamoyladenosine biosynthesis protein TsaB
MKHLLAIDTSTARASIALAVGEQFYHAEQHNIREHAKFVLPMISELLTQSGITMANLDGIVLGRGPGSFTGLRIACSVVKGLAYPHQLPVYPVSSLAAIYEDARQGILDDNLASDAGVLTIIDARMHEVYWDFYETSGHHYGERVEPVSAITVSGEGPLAIAGVGFEDYLADLPQGIRQRCIQQRVIFPDACAMIRWVRAGHATPVSAEHALPVYVRNQVVQGASGG